MHTLTWLYVASTLLFGMGPIAGAAFADGTDGDSGAPPAATPVAPTTRDSSASSATKIALLPDLLACAGPVASSGPMVNPCQPRYVSGSRWDDYVPIVPTGPSRTMYTTPVMPPTPWLLTQGEADTPSCGRVGFNLTRISDERTFTDNNDNRYEFDGEEQVLTFEVVSPRIESSVAGCCLPFHIAANFSTYTNNYAWFEGLRNFVENDLLNASEGVSDSHSIGGREASITDPTGERTTLLDSQPLLKAEFLFKIPLPEPQVGCHRLKGALSLGFIPPAFGANSDTGNRDFQFDMTLAGALPLSEHFRLTGAANLAVPGASHTLSDFGVDHEEVVLGAVTSLEWWASDKWAFSFGLTVNGPYTRDSGLPTDLTSLYGNFGVLWRPTPRLEFHVLFSENPGGLIAVNGSPATDYTLETQRDADFSLTFGSTFDF